MEENMIKVGEISHYYSKIGVVIIDLEKPLKVGDTIAVKGANTDFKQKVESMQIEHQNVQEAKAGESIGLKVVDRARESDVVYKIVE